MYGFGRLMNRPITNNGVKDVADSFVNSLNSNIPDHGVHNAAPTMGWACGDSGLCGSAGQGGGMGFGV